MKKYFGTDGIRGIPNDTLSQDLTKATVPGSTLPRRISLAYTVTVPSVIHVKMSESIQSSEVVDGQSLSICQSVNSSW